MLIQIYEDPGINSFAQLYRRTIELIYQPNRIYPKPWCLVPISHNDPAVVAQNLEALALQALRLSDAGWIVVDIASYYNITERLIRVHKISGYPFVLLEEFTLRLIRSGLFGTLNFEARLTTVLARNVSTKRHRHTVLKSNTFPSIQPRSILRSGVNFFIMCARQDSNPE